MSDTTSRPDAHRVAEAVRAELCGPGGPWETAVEDVLGEALVVFQNRHRSVASMLAAEIERWGDHECLILDDERWSYREVGDRVAATAQRLRSQYGIGRSDRVGLLAANSPAWVVTFLATAHIGAICVALNGWWTADELAHAIELTDPKLLVGDAPRLSRLGPAPTTIPTVDFGASPGFVGPSDAHTAPAPSEAVDEDDPALILFTSGTTGRAKAAVVSHRGVVGFVDGTTHNASEKRLVALRLLRIDPADLPESREVVLTTSPLFHISGLLAGVLMNLRAGATVVFRQGRFDPADVLRLIEQERVTTWTAIGTMGPQVMNHPDMATRDTSSLTRLSSGGAHFGQSLREMIRAHFPQAAMALGQGYGSSESVGVVTTIGGEEFERHPDAAGRACLGFEIEIRRADDRPVPDGTTGEVHVRSPYTMLRYWDDPDATAASLKPGRWLATGDIGRIIDGMLYLDARARDMIIRSGENVYPVEVEQRLEAHDTVAEAAVIGVDDPLLGQEVKAFVVPVADARVELDKLARWCAEALATYKVPTTWELREEPLPRNAAGKVVKGLLTGEDASRGHDR